MELLGVRLELPANTPVLMLREVVGDHRVLPIYIGAPEASAIHVALEGIVPPRPMTHDLLATFITELGGSLERVVISEVRDHTFFAELHVVTATGDRLISARPSDAVALAVRLGVEIQAAAGVLDEAAHVEVAESEDEDDADEILEEFHDFIENVNPEDFLGG
jgi:uncharacterized protein